MYRQVVGKGVGRGRGGRKGNGNTKIKIGLSCNGVRVDLLILSKYGKKMTAPKKGINLDREDYNTLLNLKNDCHKDIIFHTL